jgi:diguanylate cyclase (GGDEF)-like protein
MENARKAIFENIRIGSVFPLLLLIYVSYQLLFYPRIAQIDWYSVFSEGFVTLIIMLALTFSNRLYEQRFLYRPLIFGFSALLVSLVTDLLDEFLLQPVWVTTLLEDLPQILGYPAVVFALYRWNRYHLQLRDELQQQVITDYLTGILNRRGFMEKFETEIQRSQRYGSSLSLIWFDLDKFKEVNDQFGHHVGDEVLRLISKKAKEVIRKVDVFARMGGEEFCVMMPQTNMDGALDVAEKLRHAFEQCKCPGDVTITASFGVAEHLPGEGADHFLKRADNALYHSKEQGRNLLTVA